jgi:hypothetical protein
MNLKSNANPSAEPHKANVCVSRKSILNISHVYDKLPSRRAATSIAVAIRNHPTPPEINIISL